MPGSGSDNSRFGEAWRTGRIGSAQVAAIDRVRRDRAGTERFAEFVPTFVDHAEQPPSPTSRSCWSASST